MELKSPHLCQWSTRNEFLMPREQNTLNHMTPKSYGASPMQLTLMKLVILSMPIAPGKQEDWSECSIHWSVVSDVCKIGVLFGDWSDDQLVIRLDSWLSGKWTDVTLFTVFCTGQLTNVSRCPWPNLFLKYSKLPQQRSEPLAMTAIRSPDRRYIPLGGHMTGTWDVPTQYLRLIHVVSGQDDCVTFSVASHKVPYLSPGMRVHSWCWLVQNHCPGVP